MLKLRKKTLPAPQYLRKLSLQILEPRYLLTADFSVFQDLSNGLGSGVHHANWGDFNNDGFVDVSVSQAKLWQNNGGANFTLAENNGHENGTWGDYNNDGNLDFFMSGPKFIWTGDGTGNFTSSATLPPTPGAPTEAVTWFDLENDGDLDLYIANYGDAVPVPDTVYRNDNGNFVLHWTQPAGSQSRGVTLLDYNEDNNIDIYVTRYRLEPNTLWENDGSGNFGSFSNVASAMNATGGNAHGIGSAVGDFDNDGHIDIFAENFAHTFNPGTQLLRNTGPSGNYQFEVKNTWNHPSPDWVESYSSTAIGDVDNDGDLDFFITALSSNVPSDAARLYENPGVTSAESTWNFTNVTATAGLGGITLSSQAAFADFDNDGDLDLVTNGGLLYANNTSQTTNNNWLKVKLTGDGNNVNTMALGAVVRADLGGGKILTRMVEGNTGRNNQNDQTLHFGLGAFAAPVPLEVTWPNGTVINFTASPNSLAQISFAPPEETGTVDIGEVGRITNLTHIEQTIHLQGTYSNPIVFAQSPSYNDTEAAIARVTDVQPGSFKIRLEEPSNTTDSGTHAIETATYIVIEAGSHTLFDGTQLEVGTVETTGGPFTQSVNFNKAFGASPAILSQIQTTAGPDYLHARHTVTSQTGLSFIVEQQEGGLTALAPETVGYLAIDAASGAWNEMFFEAGVTGSVVTDNLYQLDFANSYQVAPSLLTSLASRNNIDPAHVRYASLDGNGVLVKAEEDMAVDGETTHPAERVAYLAIGGTGMLTALVPTVPIGEVGQLDNLTHVAQTINLQRNYADPVVFAQSASYRDTQPAVVRVTDVQSGSFKIQIEEPSNLLATHGAETVTYVVLEAGSHALGDGTQVEVGTFNTTEGPFAQSVAFEEPFAATPAILSQIQTTAGPDYLQTRYTTTSPAGFDFIIEQEEGGAAPLPVETVGYFAIDMGPGSWDGLPFEAGITPSAVTDSLYQLNYLAGFQATPQLLTSLATRNNIDPAHVRYINSTVTGVQLKVEEDQANDDETIHPAEAVAFFAIEGLGSLGIPGPATPVLDAEFNGDGFVNAADYTIWRDSLGTTGIEPFDLGDANGDARVDGVDYAIWKEQFQGMPTGSMSSSIASIAVEQDATGTNGNTGAFSFTLVPGSMGLDSAGLGSTNRVRQIDTSEDAALDPTARELALEILTDLLDRPAEADIDDSWQWPNDNWEQSNPRSVRQGIEIALSLVELNGVDSND